MDKCEYSRPLNNTEVGGTKHCPTFPTKSTSNFTVAPISAVSHPRIQPTAWIWSPVVTTEKHLHITGCEQFKYTVQGSTVYSFKVKQMLRPNGRQ